MSDSEWINLHKNYVMLLLKKVAGTLSRAMLSNNFFILQHNLKSVLSSYITFHYFHFVISLLLSIVSSMNGLKFSEQK